MRIIIRTTAILNLLLIISAYVCVVIAAINKNFDLLALCVAFILVSIFPTTMMLVVCDAYSRGDK